MHASNTLLSIVAVVSMLQFSSAAPTIVSSTSIHGGTSDQAYAKRQIQLVPAVFNVPVLGTGSSGAAAPNVGGEEDEA